MEGGGDVVAECLDLAFGPYLVMLVRCAGLMFEVVCLVKEFRGLGDEGGEVVGADDAYCESVSAEVADDTEKVFQVCRLVGVLDGVGEDHGGLGVDEDVCCGVAVYACGVDRTYVVH